MNPRYKDYSLIKPGKERDELYKHFKKKVIESAKHIYRVEKKLDDKYYSPEYTFDNTEVELIRFGKDYDCSVNIRPTCYHNDVFAIDIVYSFSPNNSWGFKSEESFSTTVLVNSDIEAKEKTIAIFEQWDEIINTFSNSKQVLKHNVANIMAINGLADTNEATINTEVQKIRGK